MTYDHVITEVATRRGVDLLDNLDVTDPVSEAVERVVRRADWWAGA